MPKARRCENWLKSLRHLTRNTETPEHFWLWAGIYTLCSALERKVWFPYGLDNLYPNIYIILVAPPGKCRKGLPLGVSKKLLQAINLTVSVDSTSKQMLTKEMSQVFKQVNLPGVGHTTQTPMAIVSKEFSSLLSVDPKQMIECLTDLYDSHDVWEYKVKGDKKPDKLYGPCVSLFAGTTPTYIANNVPYEAFGAGFFSRVVFVVGEQKKKRVHRPKITQEDQKLLEDLRHDLNTISHLAGPFEITQEADELFKNWYDNLDSKYQEVKDERFHGFIERAHVQVLKAAMALRVSYKNDLVFEADDIGRAIHLVEEIFPDLHKAFGGLGRGETSIDIYNIMKQLKMYKVMTRAEILSHNWRNLDSDGLDRVLKTLLGMKVVKVDYNTEGLQTVTWLGKKGQDG